MLATQTELPSLIMSHGDGWNPGTWIVFSTRPSSCILDTEFPQDAATHMCLPSNVSAAGAVS